MSKLTVNAFVSLDGVMQSPGAPQEDPSGGFQLGGWMVPYRGSDGSRYIAEVFGAAGAFLLGRRTYEIFAAHWPRFTDPGDPIAAPLNRLPKYVVSTRLEKADWNNSTVIRGDVAKEIAGLKDRVRGELQVHGSANLLQTLTEHGLVDEYRIWVFPVVLGRGKRLFEPGASPVALDLVETKRTGTGVVVNTYRPTGKPKFGSFALDA